MNVGVQLYSLREMAKEKGYRAALESVARAGFDCVEFAGFYDRTPEEIKSVLDELGLRGLSSHTDVNKIVAQLPYFDLLGVKQVYIPWADAPAALEGERLEQLVKDIHAVKPLLDERGIVFGYHNHAREFDGDTDRVQILLDRVDGLTSELDIFWAKFGRMEPAELVKKYGKRLSALHIKEMDKRTKDSAGEFPQAVPGEGKSDTAACIKAAKAQGVDTYILEVEYFPCEPDEYLRRSNEAMRRLIAEA